MDLVRRPDAPSPFLLKIFVDIWEYLWYAIMCVLCQVLSENISESHFGAFVKHYFEKFFVRTHAVLAALTD